MKILIARKNSIHFFDTHEIEVENIIVCNYNYSDYNNSVSESFDIDENKLRCYLVFGERNRLLNLNNLSVETNIDIIDAIYYKFDLSTWKRERDY